MTIFVFDLQTIIIVALIIIGLYLFLKCDGDVSLLFWEKYGRSVDSLAGKTVWITGCSSGLGEAFAKEFAKVKCRLILTARRTDELNRVKEQCLKLGNLQDSDILVLPMDVTNYPEHEGGVKLAKEKFGKIDVFILNAGRSQRAAWETVDINVDKELFEVNVFGQISLATLVLKHFLESGGGHFAITSSTLGKFGAPMSRSYTASKHALHGYFEALRTEHFADNIKITMMCPGPIITDYLRVAFTNEVGKNLGEELPPSRTRMTPERCAHLGAVAIANELNEVWICKQPILIGHYGFQYFPGITKKLLFLLGSKYMMETRDGNRKQK